MSKYTTQIRNICESLAGRTSPAGFDSTDDIIETAAPLLFNFEYPILHEDHRRELECKIIAYYYFREIGFETLGQFKMRLAATLRKIMPTYNDMYRTLDFEYNPLNDVSVTRQVYSSSTDGLQHGLTTTKTNTASATTDKDTEQKVNATHTRAYSNTPQGNLASVENNSYLTDYAKDVDNAGKINEHEIQSSGYTDTTANTGTDTRTISGNNTETTTGKTSGKSYQELIKEYRDNIINVDSMIIDELSDLFINLW